MPHNDDFGEISLENDGSIHKKPHFCEKTRKTEQTRRTDMGIKKMSCVTRVRHLI